MLSKIILSQSALLTASTLMLANCSASDARYNASASGRSIPVINDEVKIAAPSAIDSQNDTDGSYFITTDRSTNSILRLRTHPLAIDQRVAIPFGFSDEAVVAGPDGEYLIVTSKEDFAIITRDGHIETNPLVMPGEIIGMAIAKEAGIVVLLDRFGSVGILILDDAGTVERRWIGGSLIGGDASIASVLVTGGGQLVAFMSDKRFARIDVDQTIANNSYAVTFFDPKDLGFSIDRIDWWAATTSSPSHFLLRYDSGLYSVNADTASVTDKIDLGDNDEFFESYARAPHVIASSGEGNKLYYADAEGKIVKKTLVLPGLTESSINRSWLDADFGSITVGALVGQQSPNGFRANVGSIFRFRLADSLFLGSVRFDQPRRIIPSSEGVMLQEDRAFGHIEFRPYQRNEAMEAVSGFNFKTLLE